MASWLSNTAKSVVMPTPISATRGSSATGTVRERGMPLLSAQWIVTPAIPRAARSSASCCAPDVDEVMAPVRSSSTPMTHEEPLQHDEHQQERPDDDPGPPRAERALERD